MGLRNHEDEEALHEDLQYRGSSHNRRTTLQSIVVVPCSGHASTTRSCQALDDGTEIDEEIHDPARIQRRVHGQILEHASKDVVPESYENTAFRSCRTSKYLLCGSEDRRAANDEHILRNIQVLIANIAGGYCSHHEAGSVACSTPHHEEHHAPVVVVADEDVSIRSWTWEFSIDVHVLPGMESNR